MRTASVTSKGRAIDIASQVDEDVRSVPASGSLICRLHTPCAIPGKSAWSFCSHIQGVIERGTDAISAWALFEEGVQSGMVIPLIPKFYIFPYVRLEPDPNVEFAVKVRVNTPPDWGPGDDLPQTAQSLFLGYLSPGEGRQVIRKMLHNWFEPESQIVLAEPPAEEAHNPWGCGGGRHGRMAYERTMRALEAPEDKQARFAHSWAMTFHEICLMCYVDWSKKGQHGDPKKKPIEKFDADLIPS